VELTGTQRVRVAAVVALFAAALGAMLTLAPIPQDPAYHAFADTRDVLGIANGLNVWSNLPFVLVALSGFAVVSQRPAAFREAAERLPYLGLFAGLAATALGSAYYHAAPDGARLFWDRLPMTVAFMSLFAAVLAERVTVRFGLRAFPLLLALGVASIVYARQTDDLRFYLLVQGFPIVALPLLLALFPAWYTRGGDLLGLVGWYLLAKVFERLDQQVFETLRVVSGHTLKHLFAALAIAWVVRMLRLRHPLPEEPA